MTDFGHLAISGRGVFLDAWGAGPYTIRVGKRRYYFTDSDMFGPLLEDKHGRVLDRQPISEKHPFWAPYHMWRKLGRRGRKIGRHIVCRWRMPRRGAYWKDEKGVSHFVVDPEYDALGYAMVQKP